MTTPQPAEFVALWSEHSRAVYAYIYALVFNSNDADDIFQETSLTLFEKFADFEPGTNFAAWAYRVAYLKVLQFLERRRLPEHVDEHFLAAIEEGARGASTLGEPRFAALRHCLAKLSAKDHRLIQLRYQRGATVKSVAEKFGRSAPVIYKSLARLHNMLLECIRRRLDEGSGP
jgi:RNA polymerase sigma-70 factor (ECF subfamily)